MNHARWRVVELYHPRDLALPRAVFACGIGESPWRIVWRHRDNSTAPVKRSLPSTSVHCSNGKLFLLLKVAFA